MVSRFDTIASYNRGDQGFVNEYFPSYSRLPSAYNVVKHNNGNPADVAYKASLVSYLQQVLIYHALFMSARMYDTIGA